MQSVKGLQGYWHATTGVWATGGNQLLALCRRGISPNNRRMDTRKVDCPKCLMILG